MKTRLQALPPPSEDQRAHAARVSAHIAAAIDAADGCLPFDRFMELALYAPGLGYYAAGLEKFGPAGDFVTAPELGAVFGGCLARQCAEVLTDTGGGSILEFGAGSGALCRQVMEALASLQCLPDHYWILETSAALKARQMDAVASLPADLARRVGWLERLPDTPFTGVVIANEVLDAMPVTRFAVTGDGIEFGGVKVVDEGFHWCAAAAPPPCREAVADLVRRHALAPGYCSEYRPRAAAWVSSLSGWLDRGAALIIDYGYPAGEYYHAERRRGTLQCFFRHAAHDDPLVLAGIQDITAHVDFSSLAGAARDARLDILGYAALGAFLLGAGLLDVVGDDVSDAGSRLALANEVKQLTLPTEMGELVKVLALGRGLTRAPSAFDGIDRSPVLLAA